MGHPALKLLSHPEFRSSWYNTITSCIMIYGYRYVLCRPALWLVKPLILHSVSFKECSIFMLWVNYKIFELSQQTHDVGSTLDIGCTNVGIATSFRRRISTLNWRCDLVWFVIKFIHFMINYDCKNCNIIFILLRLI